MLGESFPQHASELLESGESAAYLYLSGSMSAQGDVQVGQVFSYKATVPTSPARKETFEYEVLQRFTSARGLLGQAVVFRALRGPKKRMVIAFRGVRTQAHAAKGLVGHSVDTAAMLRPLQAFPQYWNCPSDEAPSSSSRPMLSDGVRRYLDSICSDDDPGNAGGLVHWLRAIAMFSPNSFDEVHFTGHSFGGTLAQGAALRVALEPSLQPIHGRVRLLAFGSVPWLNESGAELYRKALGSRAVHLVTQLLQRCSRPSGAKQWAMPACAGDADSLSGSQLFSFVGYDLVRDPLTTGFAVEHAVPHNTFAIENLSVQEEWDKFSMTRSGLTRTDRHKMTHLFSADEVWTDGARVVQPTSCWPAPSLLPVAMGPYLAKLMQGTLEQDDPLLVDFFRLHRGRSYRAALLSVASSLQDERARAQELEATTVQQKGAMQTDAADAAEPKQAPSLGRTLSKRSLAALLDEPKQGDENGPSDNVQRKGMTKIASYGSLTQCLDSIAMF